jgi:hypothetical protein
MKNLDWKTVFEAVKSTLARGKERGVKEASTVRLKRGCVILSEATHL